MQPKKKQPIDIDAYIKATGVPEYWASPEGQRAKRQMESSQRGESLADFLRSEAALAEKEGTLTPAVKADVNRLIATLEALVDQADRLDAEGDHADEER